MNFVGFGANVRKLRKERRLTQEELAELAEISVAYLCKIENRKATNVSLSITSRLAEELGVTPGYLIGQTDIDKMLDDEILQRISDCSPVEKKKILKIIEVIRDDEEV